MKRSRIPGSMAAAGLLCIGLCLAAGVATVSGQAAMGGGASGGGIPQENTLVIRETPDNLKRIEQIIRRLDVAPRQVLIEAHIFDVVLDDQSSTGIDWSSLMTQIGRTNPLWQYDHSVLGAEGGNGTFRFGTLSQEHFQLVMKGLKKDNRARSLSNPKVTTISGQRATIEVGQRIPYTTTETIISNGTTQTNRRVQFEDVPINLAVTPNVYDDGTIRMAVQPTITALISFVEGVPWTEKRTSNTDLVIKSGQTLILGGLITERRSEDRNSVPVFEKIPLVKKLFSTSQKTTKRSELVVFITPNIIRSAPIRGTPVAESSDNSLAWR